VTGATEAATPSRPELPARFRDLRPLPGRTQGALILADDAAGGGPVVVKLGGKSEIEAEAQALSGLEHAGIVRVRASGASGDLGWLAVDLVPGVDLETWAARNRATPSEVGHLLDRLAETLASIHAAGIVHRDIKPANVVLPPNGQPVLIDLGAAGRVDAPTAEAGVASRLSDGYAAPEQYLAGRREGPWTDVYGLAALGYRLLTGAAPPPAPMRLRQDTLVPVHERQPACPPGLAAAIDKGLALDLGSRPQDMQAWRALLRRAVGSSTGFDEGPPTVQITRRPVRTTAAPPAPTDAGSPRRPRWQSARVLWPILLLALASGASVATWRYWVSATKMEWLVDPTGGGDARTIGEAVAKAEAGARVLVRSGIYAESLAVDRPLSIVAADSAAPPVIAPVRSPCAILDSDGIELAHFALQAPATEAAGSEPCLAVSRGASVIENVMVTASKAPALLVSGGAAPRISGGRLAVETGPAVLFMDGAAGSLANTTVAAAAGPALVVRGGSAPEVVQNDFEGGGVVVAEGARPVLRENRLVGVRGSAIEIASGAAPSVVANTIERPAEAGVFVHDAGGGRIADNRIEAPGLSGIVVTRAARPELVGNTVRNAKEHGVLVVEGGGGAIEGNTVERAQGHGIAVGSGSDARIGENRLENNRKPQLLDGRES
jgi:parallel beta-helix repeat protein